MKKNSWRFLKALAAGVLVASAGLAQASFVVLSDGGLNDEVLDTTTNLIWLKNWNVNGTHSWLTQEVWAAGLTTGGVAAGTWRLPTGDYRQGAGPGNEFLQLWNDVGMSYAGLQTYFDNVQSIYYWSGSEIQAYWAAYFNAGYGVQNFYPENGQLYAVAVRPGDVAAAPEPESMALVLVGLMAARLARRRPSL